MSVEITMPQLSDTMNEGTILNWLKQEGDTVKRGEALAEVATDKADLEIESFHEGTLLKIFAPKGATVKVGSVIAVVGEQGTQVSAPQPVAAAPTSQPQAAAAPAAAAPVASTPAPSVQVAQAAAPQMNGYAAPAPAAAPAMSASRVDSEEERVKISPLARNLASNLGVDVASLSGSGEGGRIVKRDIERAAGGVQTSAQTQSYIPAPAAPSMPAPQVAKAPQAQRPHDGPAATEQLSRMRQTIAARMVESTTTIPHFYVTSKVMVDGLIKVRQSLKPLPQYEGLTFNHLIVKASALALRAVPRVNAAFQNNNLLQPQAVNVGIVTAVPDGLLIPVLKNADQMALADIVAEGRALVQRARSGRPKPDDLVGGTFSISNMGMFGVESFTAIISPGQGAILAVSPIQEEAIVVDGEIKVGSVLRVTLSVDHRIIDGVIAGEFLTELKRLLEDPVLLLA